MECLVCKTTNSKSPLQLNQRICIVTIEIDCLSCIGISKFQALRLQDSVRYAALLMWSLFLIGRLYLSGIICQGLQLRMNTKKDKFHNEIGPCAQTIVTILGLIVNKIERVYLIV